MAEALDTKIIFLVHLTDISLSTKVKGQKSTKTAKTKEPEMDTSNTPENYLTFLTGLLSKFGENSDFITDNNTPFSVLPLLQQKKGHNNCREQQRICGDSENHQTKGQNQYSGGHGHCETL